MTSRREALAWLSALVLGAGDSGCGAPPPPGVAGPATGAPRLRLDPLVDIVPSAGLEWLVQAKPRALFGGDDGDGDAMRRALEAFAPPARWEALAGSYGGVDVRRASEVVVAAYPDATLALVRVPVDGPRVEAAFAARAVAVEGRAIDRGVIRTWGTVGDARVQVALFGQEAVAVEYGRLGPLRAAVYFAQGRLKRALPALRAEPLATAAERIGEAPLRAFAPGPFEGGWSGGLGGLLRATTAAAVAAHLAPKAPHLASQPDGPGLGVRVLLSGGWDSDAAAAAERLAAAFQVLAADPLGRLLGIDQPLAPVTTRADRDGLELEVALNPLTLTRGLRAATGAGLAEILGLSSAD